MKRVFSSAFFNGPLLAPGFLVSEGFAGNQSALDPAGPQAERISQLWWLMFWVCAAVFVLVIAATLYAILRSRREKDDAGERLDAPGKMTRAITASVIVTTVILFVFLAADLRTDRALSALSSEDPVTIKVTGYQWWWRVQYEDPVASRTVSTANEIHIPIGEPVLLKMTSAEVIHSLWAPNLNGKKDLIPGYETKVWFQANEPGTFRGQCAEFCGHQHANMAFSVVAEPPEQFREWLEAQRQPSRPPSDPVTQNGLRVFLSSPCVMCHTIRGTLASASVAPDLTHLASRQTIAAGTLPNTRGHLGGWIVDPQGIKPGVRMPPNSLRSEDLQSLLTYLGSLE